VVVGGGGGGGRKLSSCCRSDRGLRTTGAPIFYLSISVCGSGYSTGFLGDPWK